MRSATVAALSTCGSPRSSTPSTTVLSAELVEHAEVEVRLRGLDRDLLHRATPSCGRNEYAVGLPVGTIAA